MSRLATILTFTYVFLVTHVAFSAPLDVGAEVLYQRMVNNMNISTGYFYSDLMKSSSNPLDYYFTVRRNNSDDAIEFITICEEGYVTSVGILGSKTSKTNWNVVCAMFERTLLCFGLNLDELKYLLANSKCLYPNGCQVLSGSVWCSSLNQTIIAHFITFEDGRVQCMIYYGDKH